MRYPASEKLEIIRTIEGAHLPVRQTLAMLGIPSTTHHRWYDRWSEGGLDALEDTAPHPGFVWNRLPDATRADIIELAELPGVYRVVKRLICDRYDQEKPDHWLFGTVAWPRRSAFPGKPCKLCH